MYGILKQVNDCVFMCMCVHFAWRMAIAAFVFVAFVVVVVYIYIIVFVVVLLLLLLFVVGVVDHANVWHSIFLLLGDVLQFSMGQHIFRASLWFNRSSSLATLVSLLEAIYLRLWPSLPLASARSSMQFLMLQVVSHWMIMLRFLRDLGDKHLW